MNRRDRRANGTQPEKPPVQIHIGVSDRGRDVVISETAANVLRMLCDAVPIAGSAVKAQVAFAQGELEEALAKLESDGPAKPDA